MAPADTAANDAVPFPYEWATQDIWHLIFALAIVLILSWLGDFVRKKMRNIRSRRNNATAYKAAEKD